VFEN
jgi:hypothetical protein